MSRQALSQAIESVLGARSLSLAPLAGGDINDAYRARLADGRAVFVKTHPQADRDWFEAEAHGLDWLRAAGSLRTPRVLGISPPGATPALLILEYLEPGRKIAGFDERLGQGLAALHRFGAAEFGLSRANRIGRLPQDNRALPDWPSFYGERRLAPQVELAVESGKLSSVGVGRFERLYARLPELCGPEEPPSRLHGDLWGGNLHIDPNGEPCLIDPAAYGGHREIDLAMMRLFGGFSERVFAAYEAAFPLAPGAAERILLYQLYPLLVHLNLFGRGYLGQVESALDRYL